MSGEKYLFWTACIHFKIYGFTNNIYIYTPILCDITMKHAHIHIDEFNYIHMQV